MKCRFIILRTMSDRVGNDGVGVSGLGGRGDYACHVRNALARLAQAAAWRVRTI